MTSGDNAVPGENLVNEPNPATGASRKVEEGFPTGAGAAYGAGAGAQPAVADASERLVVGEDEQRSTTGAGDRAAMQPVPPDAWRPFSYATPLSSVAKLWGFVVVALFAIFKGFLEGDSVYADVWDWLIHLGTVWIWRAVGILAAVGAVTAVCGAVIWHFTRFALVEDGIHLRRGVLIKRHLHMRWDRVQTVDVTQRFFARLIGQGSVLVASAGTETIELGLLRRADCEALRATIMHVSAQARAGETIRIPESVELDDTGERITYRLPTGRLVVTSLLSGSAVVGVLSVLFSLWLADAFSVTAIVPLLVILATALWNGLGNVARKWGCEVRLAPAGVQVRAGLGSRKARTLLPGRVHAVILSQPLLWRRFDWWRLQVVVARSALDVDTWRQGWTIPAGSRQDVLRMLWCFVPDLGVEDAERFLAESLDGAGASEHYMLAGRNARWFNPLGWQAEAIAVTTTAAVLRRGRWRRQVQVILHEHCQSLALVRGPFSRWLGLAGLRFCYVQVPGEMTQRHMDLADAQRLLWEENRRTIDRRKISDGESLEQWRMRVGVVDGEGAAQVNTGTGDAAGDRLGEPNSSLTPAVPRTNAQER